jgi:hypothetical protein
MRAWKYLIAAGCIVGSILDASVHAQTTPAIPPAPEAPAAVADSTPVSSHVTRHRLSVKVLDGASADSLRKEIGRLQAEIDRLRLDNKEGEVGRLERQIALLSRQLARTEVEVQIQGSPDLGLADINLPKVGAVLMTDSGALIRVPLPPELKSWKRRKGDRVGVFDPVFVESSERIEGNVVGIFSNVHVGGYLEKQAVSIGGDVYIDGTVEGDVVAPFGQLYLSSTARILGDAVAAHVFAEDGSVIEGTIEETSLPRIPGLTGSHGLAGLSALLAIVSLTFALIGVLLCYLALGVAPRHVQIVEERLRDKPVGSFFGGFAFEILSFPVWLLLVITIIGIPVAFLALPLVMLAATVLGFAAFAVIFGRALLRRSPDGSTPWLPFTVGAVLLHLPLLLGLAASQQRSSWAGFAATLLLLLGIGVMFLATTAGFGAAILSRLGTRPVRPAKSAAGVAPIGMPPPPGAPNRAPMPGPPGPVADAT